MIEIGGQWSSGGGLSAAAHGLAHEIEITAARDPVPAT
jgi:hypothetical protein